MDRRAITRWTLASALSTAALTLPFAALAHGDIGGGTLEEPRVIAITTTEDLHFDPAEITVEAGEVVRFIISNPSSATHDFLIGDLETQEEHSAQMAAGEMHVHGACPEPEDRHADEAMTEDMAMSDADMPMTDEHVDGEDDHTDVAVDLTTELCPGGIPGAVTVEPGGVVGVLARFDEPGETLIGCHEPGHWQAGMRGVITILEHDSASASLEA